MAEIGVYQKSTFGLRAADGLDKYSSVHKFGRALGVSGSFVPIASDQRYLTPSTLTPAVVITSASADAPGGSGAQEITIIGIGSGWTEKTCVLATVTASSVTATSQFYRIYRAYVSKTGTYATDQAGSHVGDIKVRTSAVAASGDPWCSIENTGFAKGQTQVGAYTVASGKVAYVPGWTASVDSLKTGDVLFFVRSSADKTGSAQGAMRLLQEIDGIQGSHTQTTMIPYGPFVGPCDIGFLGAAATSANMTIDFEIILRAATADDS